MKMDQQEQDDELEQTAQNRGEKDVPPPVVDDGGPEWEVSEPDSDNQSTEDIADTSAKKHPFRRRKVLWIVVIVVAVLVAIGVAGGVAWNGHAKEEALSDCRQSAEAMKELAGKDLDKNTIEALKIEKKDVADTLVWQKLRKGEKALTRFQHAAMPSCDATSRAAAEGQRRKASAQLDSLKSTRTGVRVLAKRVLASRDAKTLKDTRDGLAAKTGQAKQLLDSSAGNVADEATRSALSQQVEAANGLLGDQKSKLAVLQQMSKALDDAMNGVNASIQAKAAADAQAAAEAAQQQANAQAAKGRTSRSDSSRSSRGASAPAAPSSSGKQIHGFAGSSGEDHGPQGPSHGICFGPGDCYSPNN
ncbi:hypothetical protein OZX73_07880 [Bifidobacterium sp. ESL0775]|uniref:hypothetical protein n=1 Tax=Bifidobacterium sp. ESL0775 TaxID=2983230 RepID=UPI0023F936FC|nr:hypothetical protein [Bifidobacterium sp. ESL0775]WEV69163.1 hypothetical protein OZX73_07880 [Bifidobacterium sp. ESL0775]